MNTHVIMSGIHAVIVVLALIAITAKGYHETFIQHTGLILVVLLGLGMVFGGRDVAAWVEAGYMAGIAIYGAGTGLKHWLKHQAARRALLDRHNEGARMSRTRNWLEQVAGDVEGLSIHQDTVVIDPQTAQRLRSQSCATSPHSLPPA